MAGYLSKGRNAHCRELLRKGYNEATYEGAKSALQRVKKELSLINESGVRSLE